MRHNTSTQTSAYFKPFWKIICRHYTKKKSHKSMINMFCKYYHVFAIWTSFLFSSFKIIFKLSSYYNTYSLFIRLNAVKHKYELACSQNEQINDVSVYLSYLYETGMEF